MRLSYTGRLDAAWCSESLEHGTGWDSRCRFLDFLEVWWLPISRRMGRLVPAIGPMIRSRARFAKGSKHDGTTLFPITPYSQYRSLSDEDLASVVVYVRSVAPVRNALSPSRVNFPVNLLVQGAPKPVTKPVSGPAADPVSRGKYLVNLGCGCHNMVAKLPYGGGEVLAGPWGWPQA